MRLGVCSDYAGYQLKEQVKEWLAAMQIECVDYGAHSEERCDYPDYAYQLAFAIQIGIVGHGIAIYGTGNSMATTLDKYNIIRVGLAWNEDIAKLVHAHNDANVLVTPVRFIGAAEAERCLHAFLNTPPEGGRHKERIDEMVLPAC